MGWLEGRLNGWLAWLAVIAVVTVSNPETSSVNEVPNALHVTAGNISVKEDEIIDSNGYVLFCPCMGK